MCPVIHLWNTIGQSGSSYKLQFKNTIKMHNKQGAIDNMVICCHYFHSVSTNINTMSVKWSIRAVFIPIS